MVYRYWLLLLVHASGVSSVIGERIVLPAIPETWRKRVGRYEVINPDQGMPIDQVRLEERHHALQIHLRPKALMKKAIVMTLLPFSDTEALIAGLGRGRRETIHTIVRDGTTNLSYSGFEFRKIMTTN